MKTNAKILALGAGLVSLGLAFGAGAQQSQAPAAGAKGVLVRAEAGFLKQAGEHGLAEVELGRLGQEKGLHEEVKAFAARMVADHGKANEELMGLAASKGVQLPTAPDRKHQRDLERLRKPAGPDFDRAYMKHMVDDHRRDVRDFERMAKNARDVDVREFASRQLVVLRAHLQAAQATHDLVQGSKRTGDRGTGSPRK